MFKEMIAEIIAEKIELKKQEILELIEIPKQEFGDYAFPCFILAKKFKKSPQEIAKEISKKLILEKEIEKIEVQGAYINFFINKNKMFNSVIPEILKEKTIKKKDKKAVMVEFSQANTHKAFHIGHIRGTSIGESLSRILEYSGKKIVRANYQGDIGMHVAKWLWCYLKYHKKEKLKKDEAWIAKIYVEAIKKLGENEEFQEQVDEINRKLETKQDEKLNKLWKETRKISLNSLEKIYNELNTKFDVYYFESELDKKGKEISKKLLKEKIAEKSDDALIIDFDKKDMENLGKWVLLRKDETVLYSAKDLALAEKKFKDFNLEGSIYIIGSEQRLHFEQLVKTLELMRFKKIKDIKIIHFDLVRLPGKKMSSRTGENILYSDFIKELVEYSKKEIKRRFPKISKTDLEKRALAVSIASMKYSMLKQDSNKVIVFNKQEALNFEGDSGPYLLYSYARASSILRKAGKIKNIKDSGLINSKEYLLITKLYEFQDIIKLAYKHLNPAIIANYSFQLSQIFNDFYESCPVLKSEPEERAKRLMLVRAFTIILKNSLSLLGINAIERM